MTGYYDIVLGLIPLSLAGLTALLLAAGMSLSASVPLASIASLGLMGHAMFVNGPVSTPTTPNGGQAAPETPASGNGPSLD
ncbi:hypothetical protein [Natronomonas sp.]|uniref:hypothetical protein n=1 Tax=Natronomonas sp. TaxID=2184060 RepID=UPI002FC2FFAC